MIDKDLLVIYNIFGTQENEDKQIKSYTDALDEVYWHLDNAVDCSCRVVVSANMVSDYCIETIKEKYEDRIHIFKYDTRLTVQIATNKTILSAINHFKEEYEGYFYIGSGLRIPKKEGMVDGLIEKNRTGLYGIIQLNVNNDHGNHFLGFGPSQWINEIDFSQDYHIPPGNHCNFHAAVINRKLKDFYEFPVTDVHGKCGMESVLSYCCAALRLSYILFGGYCLRHERSSDTFRSVNVNGRTGVPCHEQMFKRDKKAIAADPEAIASGIGYYPGSLANNEVDWNGVILQHNPKQFDENHLALNGTMKLIAKKYFFSTREECPYDNITVEIF